MTGPSMRRATREVWMLYVVIVALVVTFVSVVAIGAKQVYDQRKTNLANSAQDVRRDRDLACIANWANDFAARQNRLERLSSRRFTALDKLVRAVATGSQARVQAALAAYLHASDDYNSAVLTTPLPPAPRFACDLSVTPSPPTPSRIPVTVTVTPPAVVSTTTRPAPGPTVTERASPAPTPPPRTVTRTATRTPAPKTRTVTRTASPTCRVIIQSRCVVR